MTAPRTPSQRSIRRHLLAGLVVVLLLAGGIGGWASTAQLSGALVAPGSVVVDSNIKKVQHPTGGVVGELRARDGDVVKAGDILVRLDDTVTKASLAIVTKGLNAMYARAARLQAESLGADHVTFPKSLLDQAGDPDAKAVMASEENQFQVRLAGRLGQRAQLHERVSQLQEEIRGLTAQEEAKSHEIELINKELVGVRDLYAKNLVQISRLTALERDAARLEGDRGQFVAAKAQAKGKIAETELQVIQVDKDLSTEVSKELREVNDKIGELVERKVTAEDQLRRIEIRAPQDGVVLQSNVHTVGGVIAAGDTIMQIVPQQDALAVEAKVNPQDVDQVRIGQKVLMRFSAFNQRTTPEVTGNVVRLSPDTTTDQRTGQSFYTIRVAIPPAELARLGNVKLLPGMPVETFVQTGERTMLAYLAKPLHDQFMRAFREK
ncbi:MAG: HlyD family type I secretion periplasmic adaptor subunit [Xanthobacteraceae bacterium]